MHKQAIAQGVRMDTYRWCSGYQSQQGRAAYGTGVVVLLLLFVCVCVDVLRGVVAAPHQLPWDGPGLRLPVALPDSDACSCWGRRCWAHGTQPGVLQQHHGK